MTNTTSLYWEADGQSLQTFARNIDSLEGKLALPPFRGTDTLIPYKVGQSWSPKQVDSRILPLSMWVVDTDADGNIASTKSERQANFDANWRALVNLLWTPGRQFMLTKRFTIGGVVRSATALAEYVGGLAPSMMGRYGARTVVNLKLADPYFYDDEEVSTTLVNGNQNVSVLGDAPSTHIEFVINGARNQPVIRNNTEDLELQYNSQLLSGDYVTIDVEASRSFTVDAANPLGYTSNARIIHSGAVPWFYTKPGTNQINLASTTGSGIVVMKRRDAWL